MLKTIERAEYLVQKCANKKSIKNEPTTNEEPTTEGNLTYDILENNCEHSALWCKTGVHVSTQVKDLTGPTGCVTMSVKHVLLLLMRLCGVLGLFIIEAIWPDEPGSVLDDTSSNCK